MNKPASPAAPRPRGRPPKSAAAINKQADLTRSAIIEKVLALTATEPLDGISIVQVAREFDVVPGLIYYYIGSRDNLITGVMNLYYKGLCASLPALSGDWRRDVAALARAAFDDAAQYPGVVQYITVHNRYRLFQQVGEGETDYGAAYFNQSAAIFLQGGFAPPKAAMAYQLLAQFITACAMARAANQAPLDHADYIRAKFEAMPQPEFASARTMGLPFAELDAATMFDSGLDLLLDGFARWLP